MNAHFKNCLVKGIFHLNPRVRSHIYVAASNSGYTFWNKVVYGINSGIYDISPPGVILPSFCYVNRARARDILMKTLYNLMSKCCYKVAFLTVSLYFFNVTLQRASLLGIQNSIFFLELENLNKLPVIKTRLLCLCFLPPETVFRQITSSFI